jgi:hypothetical protein
MYIYIYIEREREREREKERERDLIENIATCQLRTAVSMPV